MKEARQARAFLHLNLLKFKAELGNKPGFFLRLKFYHV
jgi:hypothetical protein